MLGRVKWFNDVKGYGFIASDKHTDIFAHYAAIETEGFKTLAEGQEVEFDLIEGPNRSLHAMNIRKVVKSG